MTKEEAFALMSDLVDHDISAQVSCHVTPNHVPHENWSVAVGGIGLNKIKLRMLLDIGDFHHLEPHLLNNSVQFFGAS